MNKAEIVLWMALIFAIAVMLAEFVVLTRL